METTLSSAQWQKHAVLSDPEMSETTDNMLTLSALQTTAVGSSLQGQALVIRLKLATDRSGHAYLQLTLRSADNGSIEARWWRYPYPLDQRPLPGKIFGFIGIVDSFSGERQLRVLQVDAVADASLVPFMRATRRSLADLLAELERNLVSLPQDLGALARAVLSGEVYTRFCTWPAAQYHHGAVRHGLLAHSVRVAEIARRLSHAYGVDGLPHDQDLVITACLLHDIGKVRTLPEIAGTELPEEAGYFDHATVGMLMIRDAAARADPSLSPERLEQLLHIVLTHHGHKEWGAAVAPNTVGAWLLHVADYAESRLWEWSTEEAP